jgi:hypothetical protein
MWLKLSDDFADLCARHKLSDAAFRTLVESLLWAMRRENGGSIDTIDIKRFAESPEALSAVTELVDKQCWSPTESGYQVQTHMELQVEPDVLATRRQTEAIRQREYRAKKAKGSTRSSASRRDNQRDETRDPGLVWSGQDWSGQDESTHLGKELEKNNIDMCIECGVEPCGCFQEGSQSENVFGLQTNGETKW